MRMLLRKYLLSILLAAATPVFSQALPNVVANDLAGMTMLGKGTMRFIGLKVYDVSLWTAMKPFSYQESFALELVYDMNFKGRDIAERSIKEMRGQGYNDETKLKRWLEDMTRIFPDIKPGDMLVGVNVPGKEARFYSSEKFIAAVPDPEFAKAFFDIWLSEKTSEPGVRNKLLIPSAR